MLRLVVELDVPVREDQPCFGIVLDVFSAEPEVLITDVHMAVGIEGPADLALLVRFERNLAARGGKLERYRSAGLR
jgi:hypothetical protein